MNSSELKGFLTGLMFGGANIGKGITKRDFTFQSHNKEFVEYIKSILDKQNPMKISITHRSYWNLKIDSHPYFNKIYNHFYDDNRHRIVSKEATQWLTAQGLANWFMSSGYITLIGKNSGVIKRRELTLDIKLYHCAYAGRISNMLSSKFDLYNSIRNNGKNYQIVIQAMSYQRFFNLISEYMIPSLRYKLYFGYENKPSWCTDEFWQYQCDFNSANLLPSKVEDEDIV